jgi:hypothetical protein
LEGYKINYMSLIWHYTSVENYNHINKDGYIKVFSADKSFRLKPVIWFTKSSTWDETLTKLDSKSKTDDKAIGYVRIGVESSDALSSWYIYKNEHNISSLIYQNIEKSGLNFGDIKDWYISFENIKSKYWKAVEKFDGKKWRKIM